MSQGGFANLRPTWTRRRVRPGILGVGLPLGPRTNAQQELPKTSETSLEGQQFEYMWGPGREFEISQELLLFQVMPGPAGDSEPHYNCNRCTREEEQAG